MKYEVTNLALVPNELLMINPERVNDAIRQGKTNIPGLRIYAEFVRSGR